MCNIKCTILNIFWVNVHPGQLSSACISRPFFSSPKEPVFFKHKLSCFPPGQHWFISCLYECNCTSSNEFMQYLSFLTSLFCLISSWYVLAFSSLFIFHCLHLPHFVYLSVDASVVCLNFLAIVNNGAKNVDMQIF